MYVRLAFAVAAHLEPEILVVDEVLAVGDAQFQQKCLGKMHDVSTKEGRTVLFVSHQMGTVRQLCKRGILSEFRANCKDGSTEAVIDAYMDLHMGGKVAAYRASPSKLTGEIAIEWAGSANQLGETTAYSFTANPSLSRFRASSTSGFPTQSFACSWTTRAGVGCLRPM